MSMMDKALDTPLKRRIAWIGGGAAAIAAAFGVYALTHAEPESAVGGAAAEAGGAQAVTVEPAAERPFTRRVALSGEARPRRDVRVFSPAAGTRVLELLADEGDYVRRGQPLARLDAELAAAQVRAAEASVAEAQVAAVQAQAEYQRAASVADTGALSAEAIEARRAAADAAEARLGAARAQLAEVNARLQGGYIRAPSAGLVIERPALIGQLVDGQVLFRIAGDNVLEVSVEVSEADMLALREGQRATFRLIDGTPVQARLRRPPASIDPRTRTGEALFALAPNPKLRAGMFLSGEAELPAQLLLAAPQAAILFEGGDAYVYVVDAENRAQRQVVTLGPRDGEAVAILAGLEPGARVVASGAAFLQPGEVVRPVERTRDEAPAAPAAAATAAVGQGG